MKNDCAPVTNKPCWCGSATHQECWRTARFGLLRCPSCGCYRIDPPPLDDEGAGEEFYTKYYEQAREPSVDRARTNWASRFWDVAAADPCLLEPGASALDVGCGEGQLCDELRRWGWVAVVGVDVARTRIQRARQLYPAVQFYDVPLRHTDVAPETFDLIVMDIVLEHLPNPLESIRELRWYLTPRGRLVLITPNMESGHYRLLRRRWTPELAPHAHIYLFTRSALTRLLSDAGFDVPTIGSFHLAGATISSTLSRLAHGDVKGAVWRAMQDAGGLYGRLIGAGPMLYAISTRAGLSDSVQAA